MIVFDWVGFRMQYYIYVVLGLVLDVVLISATYMQYYIFYICYIRANVLISYMYDVPHLLLQYIIYVFLGVKNQTQYQVQMENQYQNRVLRICSTTCKVQGFGLGNYIVHYWRASELLHSAFVLCRSMVFRLAPTHAMLCDHSFSSCLNRKSIF